MADDEDAISSSDEEDDDYVPSDLSDEEHPGKATKRKKRNVTTSNVRKRKILKLDTEDDNEDEESESKSELPSNQTEVNIRDEFEEEKIQLEETKKQQKADDLWSAFMSDVKPKLTKAESKKANHNTPDETPGTKNTGASCRSEAPPSKVKVSKVFDFAGEEIKITQEFEANSKEAKAARRDSEQGHSESLMKPSILSKVTKRPGGGLNAILNRLEKKPKISTLEKSKLDWDGYKKDQDIEDELSLNLKSKGGYLEKQDFLQRADLRQFEIEKNQRMASRKFTS